MSLAQIAPNLPGLQHQCRMLGLPTNHSIPLFNFSEKPIPGTNTNEVTQNQEDIKRHVSLLNDLTAAMKESPRNYKAALTIIEKAIGSNLEINELTAEFHYTMAVIFDESGRYLDAFEITTRLIKAYPAHTEYAVSHEIICRNLFKEASNLTDRDPTAPVLKRYYDILQSGYYTPLNLALAVAEQEARLGDTQAAKKKILNRLLLSPNDPDYLAACLQIARIIHDVVWEASLKDHVRFLVSRRPYDLTLDSLASKCPENERRNTP